MLSSRHKRLAAGGLGSIALILASQATAQTLAQSYPAYPTPVLIRGPVRRWRRGRRGLCLKCGYDLAGNESGVRSERGTKVERP